MRIGMLVDIYKPHVSGVINYVALNKRFLEQEGHQVFVFTFGDIGYRDEEENVYRSPGIPVLQHRYYLSLYYSKSMVDLLQTMDILHVHHPFISGQLAIRYTRRKKIPIIFTNHTRYDLYMRAYLPWIPGGLGNRLIKGYFKRFFKSIDLVIAPSSSIKDILSENGIGDQVTVIPNGVDISQFFHPTQERSRAAFGFSADDIVLIYMGRIASEKNIRFLIRAFIQVTQVSDTARLMIIGDGPDLNPLKRLVKDQGMEGKIVFTGMVEYQDLVNYLAIGDAFVTASTSEVHPLSLIEAMSSGLPALGLQSPGIKDTIIEGVNGLLSPDNLESFAERMTYLVTDHDSRISMAKQAKLVAERYSIDKTSRNLLEQYDLLLAANIRDDRKNAFSHVTPLEADNG